MTAKEKPDNLERRLWFSEPPFLCVYTNLWWIFRKYCS